MSPSGWDTQRYLPRASMSHRSDFRGCQVGTSYPPLQSARDGVLGGVGAIFEVECARLCVVC